jgi:hypothetical protein
MAAARAVSSTDTPADGAPRMGQDEWLSRVMSRQSAQMTPEVRAKIQRNAAVSARAAKSSKRAGRLQVCVGLGRIVALHYRSPTSHQTH